MENNLLPTLSSPWDMMSKLARENSRANNNNELVLIADHFYNFCVTSLSLRDHVLEQLSLTAKKDRERKLKDWRISSEVAAAHDIANSFKHFCLRDFRTMKPKATVAQAVVSAPTKREYCSANRDGSVKKTLVDSIRVTVVTEDGEYGLWEFMSRVRFFWESVLDAEGIPYERLLHREELPSVT